MEADRTELERLVGANSARHLTALARGEDDRPVVARRAAKSISEERTYGEDLTDPTQIDRALLARAEGVARQLRREGLVANTAHIKVRTGDFTTWTRSLTLPTPTDLTEPLLEAAREMCPGALLVAVELSRELEAIEGVDRGWDSILRCESIAGRKLTEFALTQADLVIRPEIGPKFWSDFSDLEEIVAIGERETEAQLDQIRTRMKGVLRFLKR